MSEDEDKSSVTDWGPIPPQNSSSVSGWAPNDTELNEPISGEIKVGEQLPPEYQSVLDELKADIPQVFRDKARETAYYFCSLEENKRLTDEKGNPLENNADRLAKQLASSGFINWVYARKRYGLSNTDPQKSLPQWVYKRHEELRVTKPLTDEEIKKVKQFYEHYSDKHAKPVVSEGQTYHTYEEGTPPVSKGIADNFKCYVEGEGLRNLQELQQTLNELRANKGNL